MRRRRSKSQGVFSYSVRPRGRRKNGVEAAKSIRLWGVDYRDVDGSSRRQVGFRTEGLAIEFLDLQERKRHGLAVPVTEPEPPPAGKIFDDIVTAYLEHRMSEGRCESSYEYLICHRKKTEVDTWSKVFKGREIASIGTEEIESKLQEWTKDRDLSPASRNRALAQLGGLLSYAYGRRWLDSHATERGRVPMLVEEGGRTRWLRSHEVKAIEEKSPAWMKPIVRFAATTGMRLGEVCTLRRGSYQVDDQRKPFVVTEKTKNGSRMVWPLEGWASVYVKRRVEETRFAGDHLFPGPGGVSPRTPIKRTLRGVVEAAGLRFGREHKDGITFHTFRHSMASLALNAGVPESTVQKMGNWKQRKMVATYAHIADETLRAASAKVAAIIEAGEDPAKAKVASKKGRKSQKGRRDNGEISFDASAPQNDLSSQPAINA